MERPSPSPDPPPPPPLRPAGDVPWTGLTICVVIAALLFFMAVPVGRLRPAELSATIEGLAAESARSELRAAIAAFRRDHGFPPGFALTATGSQSLTFDARLFVRQLCLASNEFAELVPLPDADHRFGPYLRDGVPPNPRTGGRAVECAAPGSNAADWIYLPQSGDVMLGGTSTISAP